MFSMEKRYRNKIIIILLLHTYIHTYICARVHTQAHTHIYTRARAFYVCVCV